MPLSPAEIHALLERGMRLHRDGQTAEAALSYQQAIAGGAEAAAHDLLGVALLDMGRVPDALRAFRRALAWEPSRTSALGHAGNALKASGRSGDAILAY